MPRTRLILCALLSACATTLAQESLLGNKPKDMQSVYVRDSAVASEKLALAQRMEHLKEWDKSAEVYQEITQKYADRVIPSATNDDGQPTQYVSVALVVQEKIAKWPAEGLTVYRRRFEDAAREMLNAVPEDRATAQRVMTEYFATDAGRDAAMQLMDDSFERGDFSAAAWVGSRLLTLHPGLVTERPRVLFQTALADHLGGNDSAAKPWADELQSRFANATGTVRGVDVKLADTLTAELAKQSAVVTTYQSDNWPSAFGTPDAAAVPDVISAGGAKLFSIDLPRSAPRGTRNGRPNIPVAARDRQIGAMTGILPAIDNGAMFFQDNARVYAVDLASGLPLPGWLQTYPGDGRGAFAIDARPTPAGKQMSVSVQADSVVAILGQSTGFMGDPNTGEAAQPPQLVSLDRDMGKRKWSVVMPRLKVPTDLAKLKDASFYGSPIVTGDSVYVLVHANRGGQFEECYLLSLKLADGSFQWASYVASTSTGAQYIDIDDGRMTAGPTAQIAFADDRVYVLTNQGAVACLDASDGKTIWLNLYKRSSTVLRGRRQAFIQTEQSVKPFAINPPIVTGGRVFVMPVDGESLFVYDANTGDTVTTLPRKLDRKYEPADLLLAVVNDRVVLGNRSTIFVAPWKDFDTLKNLVDNGGMYRTFTASDSNEIDAIRGRPFVSAKYVLIPTADKLYRMTLKQFKFESVYPAEGKWDDDESPGNIIATPDNLIIAGPTRVTAYADLTVATAKLDARIAQNPADVEAYLHYGELLFAAGKPSDALVRLDQAMQHMGGTGTLSSGQLSSGPARDRLFEILCNAATKAEKADLPSADVLGKLFDRAKIVAEKPSQQVRYRLTQADYYRKTGDVTAELALDQEILADASLRSASPGDRRGAASAGMAAEQSINELIQAHGVQVYAAYEAEAFKRLNAAKLTTPPDPAALLAIADEFPASQQTTEALALAGDRFEVMQQPRLATQTLRRLLQRGVTNERKLAVLESLARNYMAVPNQLAMAIVRLKQAKEIAADSKLTKPIPLADGRTLKDETIGQAVALLEMYRDTQAQASLPKLGMVAVSDGADSNKPAFKPAIELGPASIIVRPQDDLVRNDRVVAATTEGQVTAYDTSTGKPTWPAIAFGEAPLGYGYVGTTLLLIGPTHAMAIEADGKMSWQLALNALPVADVAAATDIADKADAPDTDEAAIPNGIPIQVQRAMAQNRRFRRFRGVNMPVVPAEEVAEDAAQPEQIVKYKLLSDRLLFGTSTGRVVAADLSSGKPAWQTRLQGISVKHLLANEDFVVVSYADPQSGSDVYAIDAISGRVMLHNAYNGNPGPLPTTLVNLALSPDGVLITLQGNRLLGRDLYDLSTPQWSSTPASGVNTMDLPFNASGDDNQLTIAQGRVLAVYRSGNGNLQSVRPYDLRTLQPITFHTDQPPHDVMVSYASHATADRDNTGVIITTSGPSLYIFGTHSLAAYNLDHPADEWHPTNAAANHGLTRELVIAQDYVALINQIASAKPQAPRLIGLEMALYNRAPIPSGAESGLLERYAPLRDPAGFIAEQWQVVDGAFAYATGDGKLKLVRVNR